MINRSKWVELGGKGSPSNIFQHLPTSSNIFQLLQRHPYSRKFELNAINHPQNHHFSGCYKPSPNGRFMALAFPHFYLLDHRPIRSQFLDGLDRHQTCQSWDLSMPTYANHEILNIIWTYANHALSECHKLRSKRYQFFFCDKLDLGWSGRKGHTLQQSRGGKTGAAAVGAWRMPEMWLDVCWRVKIDVFQHHFNITDINPGYVYI